jgi:DNA-binding MarR family transcriptional regulator
MANNEQEFQKLIGKVEALIYHCNDIEGYERRILQSILQEQGNEELIRAGLSLAECHVIDCIERNERINTTAIAKKLNITKGGISKITAKLVKKHMIEARRLANNQKEIYYTLTPLGKKIFRAHEILHEQAESKFTSLFCTYSPEELRFAGKFLDDLITAFQSTIKAKDEKRG